jgi:hypothetical protein
VHGRKCSQPAFVQGYRIQGNLFPENTVPFYLICSARPYLYRLVAQRGPFASFCPTRPFSSRLFAQRGPFASRPRPFWQCPNLRPPGPAFVSQPHTSWPALGLGLDHSFKKPCSHGRKQFLNLPDGTVFLKICSSPMTPSVKFESVPYCTAMSLLRLEWRRGAGAQLQCEEKTAPCLPPWVQRGSIS